MLYNEQWEKQDEVSRILNKAADLLEQKGHVKQTLIDHRGRMCAWGALISAKYDTVLTHSNLQDPLIQKAAARVMSTIGEESPFTGISPLVVWNNAPERTGQEVIDAFRLAARLPADAVRG